ncbi:MAG TPA: pilus assembly protein PilP [Gammaproteobacteria bacterium]|nr:pilus assembly protein PilP [Gammaproteobacteria bacterium]
MITRRQHSGRRTLLAALVMMTALSGCGGATDDLRSYVDEVKARPGGRVPPLPDIVPAPTFAYDAAGRRSPFAPDTPQTRISNNPDTVQGPDPNRPREFLEQFPLDTLRMVGTLQYATGDFGLVQTSDGLVHRVTVGNYIGQNYGRITGIADAEIRLLEIIPDGLGGYLERPASVGLSD